MLGRRKSDNLIWLIALLWTLLIGANVMALYRFNLVVGKLENLYWQYKMQMRMETESHGRLDDSINWRNR